MPEKKPSRLKEVVSAGVAIAGLYLITYAAFPERVRRQVKEAQRGVCRGCGKKMKLEIHHRVPQREHGPDNIYNAVGLCDTCHTYWDGQLDYGEYFPRELMPFLLPILPQYSPGYAGDD